VLQCVAACCSSTSYHIPLTTCKHSRIYIFDIPKCTVCNETVYQSVYMAHFRGQDASISASSHISVLQRVAAYRSVLQRVAACCSVLQCVAVCCSVLQCVAVCCSSASSHIPLTTCKHSEIDIFDTTKFTMCNETHTRCYSRLIYCIQHASILR